MSQVIQICTLPAEPGESDPLLLLLCDDGKVWERYAFGHNGKWPEVLLPPGVKCVRRRARANDALDAGARQ